MNFRGFVKFQDQSEESWNTSEPNEIVQEMDEMKRCIEGGLKNEQKIEYVRMITEE
jgi:hypothetical protein